MSGDDSPSYSQGCGHRTVQVSTQGEIKGERGVGGGRGRKKKGGRGRKEGGKMDKEEEGRRREWKMDKEEEGRRREGKMDKGGGGKKEGGKKTSFTDFKEKQYGRRPVQM